MYCIDYADVLEVGWPRWPACRLWRHAQDPRLALDEDQATVQRQRVGIRRRCQVRSPFNSPFVHFVRVRSVGDLMEPLDKKSN